VRNNIIHEKSYALALFTIEICDDLNDNQHYVLAKQLARSGTSIGACIRESKYAESKKDFIHKMKIALKESEETKYWISLLKDSRRVDEIVCENFLADVTEITKTLKRIIITSLKNT
jgi:four helix bundle protein